MQNNTTTDGTDKNKVIVEKTWTEFQVLLLVFVVTAVGFVLFFVFLYQGKTAFEWSIFLWACAVILVVAYVLLNKKLDPNALWVVLLGAGLLTAFYAHAQDTVFKDGGFNIDNLWKKEVSSFGLKVMQVVFLTVVARFLISAVDTIRKAATTSDKVSQQNEALLMKNETTLRSATEVAEETKKASSDAKQTVAIWAQQNELTKLLSEITEPELELSFKGSLKDYSGAWVEVLREFQKGGVSYAEKAIMGKLLERYLHEEIKDFKESKVVTNFGMYADLVGDVVELYTPKAHEGLATESGQG